MRLVFIGILLLFVQGLSAQPKPYQESLISIVHTFPFYTGQPFPTDYVKIYTNLSIVYIDEQLIKSDNPFNNEVARVVDSASVQIEKADFYKLVSAFRKLDFDSLYVPKKKREDGLVINIAGPPSEKYIIKTSNRSFTISKGQGGGQKYTEAVHQFILAIEVVEQKYKPSDFNIH